MYTVLAVVRTAYLVFILAFTVRAMPWFVTVPRTFDEQFSRCSNSLQQVQLAAWLAVAWIAFETLIGWLLASRGRRRATPPAPAPGPPDRPRG